MRSRSLTVTVNTECAHCKEPIELTVDSDLNFSVKDRDCSPIAFIPDVDLLTLREKSIINAF